MVARVVYVDINYICFITEQEISYSKCYLPGRQNNNSVEKNKTL